MKFWARFLRFSSLSRWMLEFKPRAFSHVIWCTSGPISFFLSRASRILVNREEAVVRVEGEVEPALLDGEEQEEGGEHFLAEGEVQVQDEEAFNEAAGLEEEGPEDEGASVLEVVVVEVEVDTLSTITKELDLNLV
jgi:hypothetical protein